MPAELVPLPPRDAIAALLARGGKLDPSFAWQDAWQADHAAMFTVAKSAGFDILGDIHAGLLKALAEGRTFRDFASELTPLLQAKGWWGRAPALDPSTGLKPVAQLGSPRRLETIFAVNMRVSYASGHWASFERNKTSRPFLRYVAILDEATRPAHRARHNLVLPVDDAYWNEWAPPCGWSCRCTLQQLSQRDVDRLKAEGEALFFDPPANDYRSYVNKRTGEESRVPDGIDPGWAYNPGKAGAVVAVNDMFARKVASGPPAIARAAIDTLMRSEAFTRFMADPQGAIPVMTIDAALGAALKTSARGVILSAETMRKQLREHPELTAADYAALPTLWDTATLVLRDGPNTLVLIRDAAGGRWRYAVLKSTVSGKAAFLTSYRFIRPDRAERMLDRSGVEVLIDRR